MKTLKLPFIFILTLLKNFKKFNYKLIQSACNYFRGQIEMDQDEANHQQEQMNDDERQIEQGNVVEQDAVGRILEIMGIDEFDDSENESIEVLDNNIADDDSEDYSSEDDDYEDDNNSNYDELDEVMDQDSYSSDEYDNLSEMDPEYAIRNFRRMHKIFIKRHQSQKKPFYSFQPLHLIKCSYKNHHDPWEYPVARSGHRIIASDSHLFSLGGYNPKRITNAMRRDACMLFQELWSYNFASNKWKLIQNTDNPGMPRELASNALVIYNHVLISHGGTGFPFGETCSNDCYVYTTGENPQVMLLKTTGDLPVAQYGPGIVIHKDYLYTIGGTTGFDYSCDVYRLNLITKVWENVYICRPEMRDDPEGRYRHEVVYDGRHIYVLGGGTSHTVYDLQRIPAFNLETNCWDYFETFPDRTAATLDDPGYPKARKCFSCVQHTLPNGDIEAFITGGLQGDFTTYFNDIWKLNLSTKQWNKIHSAYLPRPLYFHSAAHGGNGCMYIFGGIEYSEKDMRRRNDLFKMWMTIPKLSDICWDAVTYYNNNLHNFDRSTLIKAGIPERYVNRLPPLQDKQQKQTVHDLNDPSPSSCLVNALSRRMRSNIQ